MSIWNFFASLAEYEREIIVERTRAGQDCKRTRETYGTTYRVIKMQEKSYNKAFYKKIGIIL